MVMSEAVIAEQKGVAEIKYGGFWKRALSYIIDFFVLLIPIYCIQYFIFGSTLENPLIITDQIVNLSVWGVYYVSFETSLWQGTVGKKIMRLKVTDMNGCKVTVGQATTRYLMMIPACLLLFIDILMVAFTDKKQGLHDKVAKALVVCV